MDPSDGQWAWDATDYARDFQWLGQPRPLVQLPPIEWRLLLMGISYGTSSPDTIHARFARQILHGPWDRVVRRREEARWRRAWQHASITLLDNLFWGHRLDDYHRRRLADREQELRHLRGLG